MLLSELRKHLGAETFDRLMDEFGQTHADQEVSTAEFREFVEQRGSDKETAAIFAKRLDREVAAKEEVGGCWSIYSFEPEPEQSLIVFGGAANFVANHEIAERLQRAVARRFSNHFVPIKPDVDVTEADLKSHHLLIVGEPTTNSLLGRAAAKSPVRFGRQSFSVRKETFANPESAVIAASENPWNDRYSVVIFAGLSPHATHRIVDSLSPEEETAPQVVVFPAHRREQRFVVH